MASHLVQSNGAFYGKGPLSVYSPSTPVKPVLAGPSGRQRAAEESRRTQKQIGAGTSRLPAPS